MTTKTAKPAPIDNAVTLITRFGETYGFTVTLLTSSSYKLIRLSNPDLGIETESIKVSESAKDRQLRNTITRLRRMGWTPELHATCMDIQRKHRIAGTEQSDECREQLDKALAQAVGVAENETPKPGTVRPPAQTRRHAKSVTAPRAKAKAQPATPVEEGEPIPIPGAEASVAEIITPEMAYNLLLNVADYQRAVRKAKVREYAEAMKRGEWKLNPADPICIDRDGKTANGQHRLEAVVEAELPQPFYIARNVDPEGYAVWDRGAKRTTADMLHGANEVNTNNLAGVAKLAHLWFNVEQEKWPKVPPVSEAQVFAVLESHPGLRESVRLGRIGGGMKVSPTGSMLIHYLISRKMGDTDLVTAWFKAIAQVDLERNQPGHSLALYFLKTSPAAKRRTELTRGRTKRDLDMYLLMQGWNNTCEGKQQGTVSWKPDFKIAEPLRPVEGKHTFPHTS